MGIPMTMQGAVSYARTLHRDLHFLYVKRVLVYDSKYVCEEDGSTRPQKSSLECEYVDPLPELIREIQTRRGLAVVVQNVDLAVGVLAVARVVFGNVLQIRIQKSLTYCVKRFAVLKELLHYYDESLSSRDTSEEFLYEAICASMHCRFGRPDVYAKIHVEELCYYAAIELLLFWGHEGKGRDFLMELHGPQKMPEYFMACAFRTPLSIVQYFFEDNSRYAELSYALNLNWSSD